MRVVLFDVLLERHLTDSLSRAFQRAGHEVVATGPVWVGHRFPEGDDLAVVQRRLDEALGDGADLVFCFRPSTLPPALVERAKERGAHTLTWFSDDPVLFQHITRHLVDSYHTVLHCGGPRVLAFYEAAFDRPTGVNLPFWADPEEFPFLHDPTRAELDVAFLGSTRGDVRRHRYEVLAGLDASVRIFGRVDADPEGIYGGFLDGFEETALGLRRAKLALSIPQRFREYAGSRYDYPELRALGSFDMPSRIAQYAAMGLPVVSLDDDHPIGFPEVVAVADPDGLDAALKALLDDDLVALGRRVHRRSRSRFSAGARVALIEHLVEEPNVWRHLDPVERARYFCEFDREADADRMPVPMTAASISPEVSSLPPIEAQRAEMAASEIRSPHPWRVLYIGTFTVGTTDVVACALRGLRNLGHRVLHLDPGRHGGLVRRDAPRGGFGPNWVDVDWLEPVLDRFGPQVIVLAAGGLCLTEEEAVRLADRGILTVGLTLSDPDVFDSMVDQIGHLDLHATNAQIAQQRYERAGHPNTSLFPFAVDRAFAAADLTDAAELAAEVICIGGAQGRPERRRVMNRLAERFDVRVYGGGWDLPEAETVAGPRLIQAARAGRLHINFARTRAGFTNVKCGVFESIAAGGVVCTARFDEMARLFTYGTEIVGWDQVEDLEVKIAGLLADPERLELYRRRSFARLAAEHLYEHRWLGLFAPVLDQLDGGAGPLSDDRCAQLRDPLAPREEPTRPVMLTGFYGADNAGDDLILESITRAVGEHEPSIEFHIGSTRPAQVERSSAFQAHDRRDVGLMDVVVGDATGVVVGGGGLWHDYTFEASGGLAGLFGTDPRSVTGTARSLILAAIHGVPAHVYSMGVGPLAEPGAQAFVAWLAPQLSTLSVRDAGSAAVLEAIDGWERTITVVPDPVFALPLDPAHPSSGPNRSPRRRLGINVRPWDSADPDVRRAELTGALTELLLTYDAVDLIGVPLQRGADEAELQLVFDQLDPDRVELPPYRSGPEVVNTIAGCDGLLAMRLHACLLAHRLDVPVIGVGYDPKLRYHFDQLDASETLLPVGSDRHDFSTALRSLVEHPIRVDRGLVADLERGSRAGLVDLAQRLAGRDRPVMFAVPPSPPDRSTEDERPGRVVDLTCARAAGDGVDPEIAHVEISSERVQLGFAVGAPRQGQRIGLIVPVPVDEGTGAALSCTVTSPYLRPRNKGWISYRVLLDGVALVEEDIAVWGKPNQIWVQFVPSRSVAELSLQLVARRDCPDWSWQRPSRILLESVSVETVPNVDGIHVGASSPASWTANDEQGSAEPIAAASTIARVRHGLAWRLRRLRRSMGR